MEKYRIRDFIKDPDAAVLYSAYCVGSALFSLGIASSEPVACISSAGILTLSAMQRSVMDEKYDKKHEIISRGTTKPI